MTDFSILSVDNSTEQPINGRSLYKLEPTTHTGLTIDDDIVTGLMLVPITVGGIYDPASELIENIGQDSDFIMPKQLSVHQVYEPRVCNCSRDWESGYIEDWDVEFVETSILPSDTNLKVNYIDLIDYAKIEPQPGDILLAQHLVNESQYTSWHAFELIKLAATVGELWVLEQAIAALCDAGSANMINRAELLEVISKIQLKE